MRVFDSGATRDSDDDKLDFEGFFSPVVLLRYGEYMHQHRLQSDGSLRASDNWQRGVPRAQYLKSLLRHTLDLWLLHRGHPARDTLENTLCAIIFNAMGYLHETLLASDASERACADGGNAHLYYPSCDDFEHWRHE